MYLLLVSSFRFFMLDIECYLVPHLQFIKKMMKYIFRDIFFFPAITCDPNGSIYKYCPKCNGWFEIRMLGSTHPFRWEISKLMLIKTIVHLVINVKLRGAPIEVFPHLLNVYPAAMIGKFKLLPTFFGS